VTTGKWKAERGEYKLQVGVSSRDLRLESKVRLDTDRWFNHY